MSAHVEPTAVATLAVGLAAPLVFAHYGRSSPDRLATPLAAGVALVTAVVAVATLRVDPFWRVVWYNGILTGLFGLVFGLFGLAAYGVLERLIVPLVSRFERDDGWI